MESLGPLSWGPFTAGLGAQRFACRGKAAPPIADAPCPPTRPCAGRAGTWSPSCFSASPVRRCHSSCSETVPVEAAGAGAIPPRGTGAARGEAPTFSSCMVISFPCSLLLSMRMSNASE